MSQSLYDVLHVSTNADSEIIEAAYQLKLSKLAGKLDEDSQNGLKLVQWAYQTLIDPDKRALYDKKLTGQYAAPVISYTEVQPTSGLMDWWSTNKLTGTLVALFLLIGMYIYLGYKNENSQIKTTALSTQNAATNDSRHLDNEGTYVSGTLNNQSRAIDTVSEINKREQDRLRIEAETRANERALILDMEQRKQEQQLEMQQQQLAMQKQRQDQQLEIQKQQIEQQRIQREQRYYSCYNAAWNQFAGDGARASAMCAGYR